MSMLQPPSNPDRTYRWQVFAVAFDHEHGFVSVDCVDPSECIPGGVIQNRRFDIPVALNPEVREKVESLLSDLDDLASAAEDSLP